ncbi:hypothetical protein [Erythrobacter oryzae]|uniref:hypothetical protein n=1 Tax=Erythrobacter oryzae TaxID=3019556 RepID=UPI0025566B6E|nr:hypothetical protein [Erythrobacter sp. COR-2]
MKAGLPLLALTLALAACAPAAKAPPVATAARPAPRPSVASAPARPAPLPAPVDMHWMDAPLTPGTWVYQGYMSSPPAVFMSPDGEGRFVISCDRPNGRISLTQMAVMQPSSAMTIRTETSTRTLTAKKAPDPVPYLAAELSARDPLLDAMALSKGRFAVEVDGLPTLYLPSYAEVSRVIEDCR